MMPPDEIFQQGITSGGGCGKENLNYLWVGAIFHLQPGTQSKQPVT
jgi:hypothetical protein